MDEDLLSPLRNTPAGAEPDWTAMEQRLLAACQDPATARPLSPATRLRWPMGVTAAFVVTALAITFYRPPAERVLPTTPREAARPPAASAPQPMPSPQRKEPPRMEKPTVTPRQRAARHLASVAPAEHRTPLDDFVLLPGAAGFPALERGHIVRVEIPLTSLPAYGIDLVPDASPQMVEADFLIGQDGMPRALRLAGHREQ
jgi:hypothetical protein